MSLKLYIGASGTGKSRLLYNEIIKESIENPKGQYYIIVPDQFTMETQKEMVLSHPDRGIMNIEVLSFGRLTHRIFEETGQVRLPVLDDTGKNLILRRLVARRGDELKWLSSNIRKPGYISEVKSSISEFMQYGIDIPALMEITAYSSKRKTLETKLKDLSVLYKAFLDEISGRFVTTEGLMGVLWGAIPKSERMRGATVVFDGFTGFTPIQLRVLGQILILAADVRVSVIMEPESEDELFTLSRKMTASLYKLAGSLNIDILEEARIREEIPYRFKGSPKLAFLEKHMLRDTPAVYKPSPESEGEVLPGNGAVNNGDTYTSERPVEPAGGDDGAISIYEAADPLEEVRLTASLIKKAIRTKGYKYRDIAVVAGDLGSYGDYIRDTFDEYGIPYFMDSTKGIVLNPFTEYIKTALGVIIKDYSHESVFAFLRCGFTDIPDEAINLLENYVIKYNIRGRKAYLSDFVQKNTDEDSKEGQKLKLINEARARLVELLSPLPDKEDKKTAETFTELLYQFLVLSNSHEKLLAYEEGFRNIGDLPRASEYSRIYALVMGLLEQIYELCGEEEMELSEYLDILESGFAEITLGIIPQDVDRISVGDMERSRLKEIKALFFIGVNDGNIPSRDKGGGLLTDIDREFLLDGSYEMSPGPREKMVIQRLYLYMNMTKPSGELCISYSACSAQGESIRPSYLIKEITGLFPSIRVEKSAAVLEIEDIEDREEGLRIISSVLRDYAAGLPDIENGLEKLYTGLSSVDDELAKRVRNIKDRAFYSYSPKPLPPHIVKELYGNVIIGSVSRLEKYCECAFRYFLQYGLSLKEREEFGFKAVDMGSVCHEILERFSRDLSLEEKSLRNFSDADCERVLNKAIKDVADEYLDGILLRDARHKYILKRINRVMKRTVYTFRDQLLKGDFIPEGFETGFSRSIPIKDEAGRSLGTMRLTGSIDRIDTARKDKELLVRILDYKTGAKKVDAAAIYYGLQLQLAVYLGETLRIMKKNKKEDESVIPAGVLYYRMQDPVLAQLKELSDEGIVEEAKTLLRMEGVVNGDEGVISSMDKEFSAKSAVIPVGRNKDGSLDRYSHAVSGEDFNTLVDYADKKLSLLGSDILSGNKAKAPYLYKGDDGCRFCPYKGVCGFDKEIPGYNYKYMEPMEDAGAVEAMKSALGD